MKFNHPLMHNNFSNSDIKSVKKLFNKKKIILTQSKEVENLKITGQNGLE